MIVDQVIEPENRIDDELNDLFLNHCHHRLHMRKGIDRHLQI
jgi:hypothetical protein